MQTRKKITKLNKLVYIRTVCARIHGEGQKAVIIKEVNFIYIRNVQYIELKLLSETTSL